MAIAMPAMILGAPVGLIPASIARLNSSARTTTVAKEIRIIRQIVVSRLFSYACMKFDILFIGIFGR